jgi:hypothetical protein
MSAWVVVPNLLKLRDEFNLVSPKRDKGSDGTIGDAEPQSLPRTTRRTRIRAS